MAIPITHTFAVTAIAFLVTVGDIGRKPHINRDRIMKMKKQEIGVTQIARNLSTCRSTVYKVLNEINPINI